MYSKALFAALVGVAFAESFTVSTPASLVECQPVSLSWSGGSTAPYNLAAIPGGQPSAAALVNIASTESSPYAWTVNVAAGTSVTIKVTDNAGNIAYSSQLTVQSGTSTSCLSSSSSTSSSSTGAASSAGSSAAVSSTSGGSGTSTANGDIAAASSAGTQTTSKSSSSGSSTASTAAAAASSSAKSSAGRSALVGGALGVAGVMAAVIVA